MTEDIQRPFLEHLEELRSRILKSAVVTLLFTLGLFPFSNRIYPMLLMPFNKMAQTGFAGVKPRIVFTAPTEAFLTHMSMCFYGGIFLASPFILYQTWAFVSVALKKHEKRAILGYFFISTILFFTGAVFGFLLIVPLGLKFLIGFGSIYMEPMITIGKYISFLSMLTFAFGLVFQLPLAMVFTARTGLIDPAVFAAKRRVVIVFIFVAAALLTPPDVITQCLMAAPLLILFEIGLILARISYRKKGASQLDSEKQENTENPTLHSDNEG